MATSVTIDFIVPGFSKCGTTTLCAKLSRHPGIYIPEIKEPWYFSSSDFENKHQEYDQHFAPAREGQLKGEGSVSYSGAEYEQRAVSRIFDNNRNCRFIFIARDPRKRIESSYREMHNSAVQYGLNAPYELGECLQTLPQMVNDSLYWQRLEAFRGRFGDAAIKVIFLEDLRRDPVSTLASCFEHLGLDPQAYPQGGEINLNVGSEKLYDTRILRYLRTNPRTGFKLARLSPRTQDKLLRPLGLRRAFGKSKIEWDEQSRDILRNIIFPDSARFLAYCNKPLSFWGLDRNFSQ